MTITAAFEKEVVENVPKGALINGNWVDTGKTLEVIDPSTGEPLCEIADAGETEALAALDAGVNAKDAWAATAPRDRGEILRAVYENMVGRVDELADPLAWRKEEQRSEQCERRQVLVSAKPAEGPVESGDNLVGACGADVLNGYEEEPVAQAEVDQDVGSRSCRVRLRLARRGHGGRCGRSSARGTTGADGLTGHDSLQRGHDIGRRASVV